jgi:hypothetical protein
VIGGLVKNVGRCQYAFSAKSAELAVEVLVRAAE